MDHIQISADFREALQVLRFVANSNPEVKSSLPQIPQSAADLFRVKNDNVFAVGTNEFVVTLEPTERLLEYLSAVRARNGRVEKVNTEG